MWSFDRRALILGALALGGCGFAPVYGPGGAGGKLAGQVLVSVPQSEDGFHFRSRFEDRLGRGANGPYTVTVTLETSRQALGNTSVGDTTRYRLIGRARYILRETGGTELAQGRTTAFTGYSTTGSTVATLAAERDAGERLMVLLADQVIDALVLDLTDPS